MSPARKHIEDAQHDEPTTQLLLDIRKYIVEETVAMQPSFDYDGLDEEVVQALVGLSYYGERSRDHLTRYARQRANQFVWFRASGCN
ncbi:MAG: hypothetical protein JSR78_04220 [Proteobacteria bacterium]|nr:hypothetical protein [Pseudomonadota bacterium]